MEIERTQTQWKNQRKKHDDEKTSEKEREKEPEPNKIQEDVKGWKEREKRGWNSRNDH